MSVEDRAIIMIGAGGHARVLAELIGLDGATLAGFIAESPASRLGSVPWVGPDDALGTFDPATTVLLNGIGSTGLPLVRRKVYENARAQGFEFLSLRDVGASVRDSATLSAGTHVLPGVIVGSGAVIHENVLLNSGAIVEHDSVIGAHSHVSPGATLAGGVSVGEGVHIGIGATIVQGVTIGSNSIVGAGAVVLRDIPPGSVAVGVPAVARPLENEDHHG